MYKRVYIVLKNKATKDTLYVFAIHFVGLLSIFGLFIFVFVSVYQFFSIRINSRVNYRINKTFGNIQEYKSYFANGFLKIRSACCFLNIPKVIIISANEMPKSLF